MGGLEEAGLIRLYGGHRNSVFRTNGFVKVIWKDGFARQEQIREGVLLENFIGTHTDIRSRILVDKSRPIQDENGKLVTYFHFAEGEIRYPWNLHEIASAALLLGKFHQLVKGRLHLDFARGNVLFQPETAEAIGIIDFETTGTGDIEQDLGRTLGFLLVDTSVSIPFILHPSSFSLRMDALLTNYPATFRKELALKWALNCLNTEDYGDLNQVRDRVLVWLNQIISNSG